MGCDADTGSCHLSLLWQHCPSHCHHAQYEHVHSLFFLIAVVVTIYGHRTALACPACLRVCVCAWKQVSLSTCIFCQGTSAYCLQHVPGWLGLPRPALSSLVLLLCKEYHSPRRVAHFAHRILHAAQTHSAHDSCACCRTTCVGVLTWSQLGAVCNNQQGFVGEERCCGR